MKNIAKLTFLMVVTVLLFTSNMTSAYAEKYAFLNVAKVFDDYQKTKDNDKILQDAGKQKEAERNKIVEDIRKEKDQLELLSDAAKQEKQEALDAKVRDLQDFDLQARRELGEKRQKFVQEIFNDIDVLVQAYGKENGISFILNDRALVYQDGTNDITDDILTRLNKGYSK